MDSSLICVRGSDEERYVKFLADTIIMTLEGYVNIITVCIVMQIKDIFIKNPTKVSSFWPHIVVVENIKPILGFRGIFTDIFRRE